MYLAACQMACHRWLAFRVSTTNQLRLQSDLLVILHEFILGRLSQCMLFSLLVHHQQFDAFHFNQTKDLMIGINIEQNGSAALNPKWWKPSTHMVMLGTFTTSAHVESVHSEANGIGKQLLRHALNLVKKIFRKLSVYYQRVKAL